jgi:4,5-dihydroxyphthalate decarboxylase
VERDYYRRTGIFPIMHAVAMRNDLIDAYSWLPEAVLRGYSQAKQRQYEAMDKEWLLGTLPWYDQELHETRALMGENFWPYGIAENGTTLNALFQYSYEQGLAKQRLTIEELFHPSTLQLADV